MRSVTLFLLYSIASCILHAQTSVKTVSKPPLSISDLGKWPSVSNPKISNDGKFAVYTYKEDERQSLIIKSTNTEWEKQIAGASTYNTIITENSRFVITKRNDSLFIVNLKDGQTETVPGVLIFSTPAEGSGEWLAYQLNGAGKELVLRNIVTNKKRRFSSVTAFVFSQDGKTLLLKTEPKKDSSQLQWLSTTSGNAFIIWRGARVDNFSMDVSGAHLSFIGEDPNDKAANAVWYYTPVMDSAIVIVDNKNEGIEQELSVASDAPRFNKDGSKVFFYLQPPSLPKPKPGYVSVDVWSYLDAKLQSQQLYEVNQIKHYLAVINVEKSNLSIQNQSKVIRIEHEGDEVNAPIEKLKADYVLVNRRMGAANEYFWNKQSLLSVYLLNIKDGSKKEQKENMPFWISFYSLSPDEKFIINYDFDERNYFIYELATGFKKNITINVPVALNIVDNESPDSKYYPGNITWLTKDKALIIYDQYDIWQIDPLGMQLPINLTNGYGRKNKIVFRLANEESVLNKTRKRILLTSFNTVNKNNGFYSITLGKSGDPTLLYSCTCLFSLNIQVNNPGMVKAKDKSLYIIQQQNTIRPPSLFLTTDFKKYTPLANVPSPNSKYNWFTTELVTWKTFDGSKSQGILYKPDNFDSTKKYPILFYFYEKMSDKLNEFIASDFVYGPLNIPFFVSNGFIVFTPDIHYTKGRPGESAFNSVVSAARYFSKVTYIDSGKMGLTGFSFGGYEVNYIVTHTDIFAAANSGAGPVNFISGYGGTFWKGSAHFMYELSQFRLGSSLWENPELFILNSPIFQSDKIVTPLLLMNNKGDQAVSFSQGIEFFTALRRLKRKVWLLQYDHGDHGVDGKEADDYTKRVLQFFNYYLKNEHIPQWMDSGIPAALKGVSNGLAN